METSYSYAILCKNDKSMRLDLIPTFFNSKFLKSRKYGIILKTVNRDGSETVTHIKYFNNLELAINYIKEYPSWYDYVNGIKKDMQGNISEY